jgi:hypothetical protein
VPYANTPSFDLLQADIAVQSIAQARLSTNKLGDVQATVVSNAGAGLQIGKNLTALATANPVFRPVTPITFAVNSSSLASVEATLAISMAMACAAQTTDTAEAALDLAVNLSSVLVALPKQESDGLHSDINMAGAASTTALSKSDVYIELLARVFRRSPVTSLLEVKDTTHTSVDNTVWSFTKPN